jgi:signal transduction histidine kinase
MQQRLKEMEHALAQQVQQVQQLQEQAKKRRKRLREKAELEGYLAPISQNLEDVCQLWNEADSDPFFRLAPEGKIRFASTALARLLHTTPDEMVGNDLAVFLGRSEQIPWRQNWPLDVPRSLPPITVRLPIPRGEVVADLHCKPLFDDDGGLREWIGRLQPQHAVKEESLETQLTAGLIHELRQPLTAIGTTARASNRLLRTGDADLSEITDAIDQIARQSERANMIMQRMRDLGKGQKQTARVDLHQLIRESVKILESEADAVEARIKFEFDERIPTLLADPVQVGQVLVNLLRNAVEAVAEVPPPRRHVVVETTLGPREANVVIRDHGPGLSLAVVQRLFEPFVTTKPHGMGVGLALSRSILQAHGGHLVARNNLDRGATFSFTLPLLTDEPS